MAVTYRLRVDPIACDGHGSCAELLPEAIEQDDWGFPIIRSGPLDGPKLKLARRAVSGCPKLALRLERDEH